MLREKRTKKGMVVFAMLCMLMMFSLSMVKAGEVEPTVTPGPTMHTLEDIWNKLNIVRAGMVQMWAGTIATIPNGWKLCNGAEVSRTEYQALFEAIGTIYGEGDGSTTFNLPNFVNRSPMGADVDDAGQPKTDVSGAYEQYGGEAEHTLTVVEMASHRHDNTQLITHRAGGGSNTVGNGDNPGIYDIGIISPTGYVGGDQPHNNLHPYFASVYIIYAGGQS